MRGANVFGVSRGKLCFIAPGVISREGFDISRSDALLQGQLWISHLESTLTLIFYFSFVASRFVEAQ